MKELDIEFNTADTMDNKARYIEIKSKYRHGDDTELHCESKDNWEYGAPHEFVVLSEYNDILADIHFQKGPIKEVGRNGISEEDLLLIVALRLQEFQKTDYACKENEKALESIISALEALYERRHRREEHGVEGTSAIDYLAELLRNK